MKKGTFLVIGNDKKMKCCNEYLLSEGFCSYINDGGGSLDIIQGYKNIILPLPTLKQNKISGTDIFLNDFISVLDKSQRVFVGNISETMCENFKSYYYSDDFLAENAEQTAQGVLHIILKNITDGTDYRNIAVTGYGRCGKAVCRLLNRCGFNVTSFSRRAETVETANNDGMKASYIEQLSEQIDLFKFIVNTVPSNIFSDELLNKIDADAAYIELASEPYGFNSDEADKYKFKYILAGGLPGKLFSESAGKSIGKAVLSILKEEEYG